MSEMIKRVADVMREVLEARIEQVSGPNYRATIENINEAALQIIEEMREPTEKMTRAVAEANIFVGEYTTMNGFEGGQAWQAMIDEALK